MAEDNTGFSPLDPLGPEYGSINQPSLDQRGLSPFEGDRITQKPINFPEPKLFPVMPGINLDKPQRNVRQNLVGSPGNPVNKNASFQDRVAATRDYLSATIKASQSKDSFAKIYSYDAGPDSNAFYKRYQAYGQEKFDEIGFSPLRDNEALFNSRTTMWDDFSRMMTHSFIPLFTRGFVSGPKSLYKMIQGDFTSSDREDARFYEEAAAIGQSSKGGFSGFLNNTFMNFGYTAGIIGEAVIEEVGGALLAAPTGGASLFLATANNLRKIKGLGAVVDTMKGVNSTLKNLNNFQFAKNFWSASKNASASRVGRFFNPLENTFDAIGDMRKLSKTDNLTGLAATYKTAGGFYRDVRNLNMAVSEARLEAGMVENKRYDEDYRKLYELNKRAPTNEEQKMLEANAKDAALNTFYWNAGLIYASNKITFNNITGPRGGLRNFIKNTVDDVYTVGGGKFGNLGKIVYDNASKTFSYEANNLKQLAKSWWKQPGVKTFGKTVGYLKANFSEGIQENLQEVIARTNEKYYGQTFDSKLRQAHEYGKAVSKFSYDSQSKIFKEELGAELSAQGFETFASGFFMGMFAQPLNQAIPFLSKNYNRIFNQEEFNKYKTEKEKIKDTLVKELNDINIEDFVKSRTFNLGTQDLIADIRTKGTKKEALDAELESMIDKMDTMLATNTADLFIEKLKDISQADDKEFIDAIGDISENEVPKYRERVSNTINKLTKIQERFNYYKDKMPNPVSDSLIAGMDKKSPEYEDATTLRDGWNMAVRNAVYFNEAFDDTMVRMNDIYSKFMENTTLKKFGQSELGLLFNQEKLVSEISMQRKEIASLESLTDKSPEEKAELKKKKAYLKNLEDVDKNYTAFDNFYNRQDYYEIVREGLKKELGRDATDEEVVTKAEEIIGKIDDEKRQTKIVGNLQKSVYNYIRSVAEVNKDFVFDDNLDKSFELLLDHYKLGYEGRVMVKYINTLHNPASVFDVARRNQQWMKDMYERRAEYYDKMVKAQMDEVENNALLNVLADKGIYLNLEDFEKFLKDGIPPKEFFNNVTKQVIPQGTQEYLEAMLILAQKKELQDLDIEFTEEQLRDAVARGIESAGDDRVSYSDEQIKELTSKLEKNEDGDLIISGQAFKDVYGPKLKNKRAIALANSVNRQIAKLGKKEPVEGGAVPTNIEAKKADIERRRQEELINKLGEIALNKKSVDIIAERNDKKAVDFIDTYDKINAKYDAELAALEAPVSNKKAELEKIKSNNIQLGKSILQQAGYKNENRLPNGNVKGGQAGWKIRFNIKNPKTGDSYYADGKDTLVDAEYNKRAETLINFLLNYFGSDQKADPKNLEKHYVLENEDGSKREPFKHLSGGEPGESDFTIYIGSADDVLKFISDIRTKHPEILELLHPGNQSSDVSIDNIFKGRIEGSKIGFSGYHAPTNLNRVVKSDNFTFVHNNKKVNINYAGTSLSDINIFSEETGKVYNGVFDENMKKDLPELYKNIRNIIGFQLYGEYLTGSNNEFVKLTGVSDTELSSLATKPIERAPLIQPKSIEEVQEALKSLYNKNFVVNPEDTNTYIEVDENGIRIPGTPTWDRVSTLKGGTFDGPKTAANRGTIIDDLLRDFIDGTIVTIDDLKKSYNNNPLKNSTNAFSNGFLEDLFAIFTEVKTVADSKGLQLTSRIPTLWGEVKGKQVAGTIDLLAIDPKGNVYIIDLKTSSRNRRDENDQYYTTYKENDTIQQSAYAEMIRQRTGITVKNIVIFPVQVFANRQKTLVTAETNKDDLGNITMGVTIDREIFPEISGAVPEDEAGIPVGVELSPAVKAKFAKLGFIPEMIGTMTAAEREEAKTFNTPDEAASMRESIAARLRILEFDIPFITVFTLKKDQNLIAQTMLTYTEQNGETVIFANSGETVVVDSIDKANGKVVLQKLGSDIKAQFNIADMDKMFKLEEMGIKSEPVDIENKDAASTFTAEANDVVDAFINNRETQAAIEKSIEEGYDPQNPNAIVDQAENDLLNDLEC